MIEIGNYNTLQVQREMDQGLYLIDPDDDLIEEVLLPRKYVPEVYHIGDKIDVFVYVDSGNRPVATFETPMAVVYEFAYLRIKSVNDFGAFADWGVNKDLFIPFAEMEHPINEDDKYVVFINYDEKSNRLFGSTKIYKYLLKEEIDLEPKEEVPYLIYEEVEVGYKVIIDNLFSGILYKNQLYSDITIGDRGKAFVQKVREDGKVDLTMQPYGSLKIEPSAKKILDYIKTKKGHIPQTDKSSSEEISAIFNMSKKTFKKAIGSLYKQRLVRLEKDGTYLN